MQLEYKYTIRLDEKEITAVEDAIKCLIAKDSLKVRILQELMESRRLWEKWNICQFISYLHDIIYCGVIPLGITRDSLENIKQRLLDSI